MSTDDSPEREFDLYDSEGFPLKHQESTSNLSEIEAISNRSNLMENPKPGRKPRREVWWLDLGTTNHNLMSVRRCFEERLNWSLLSSSNSLLRRIRSPKDDNLRRGLHQCPGYLREEIALTCDLSKSVIVSHTFPGPSERCSICHQLVQYTYSDSFDSNNVYYLPPPNNSLTLPPTEEALMFNHVVFNSGYTPDSSTPFPDHMDAANQQTQQQQQPTTHVLASSDANNNQATLRLQLSKISRLGSLIFGKNAKGGFSDIFGSGKSHQITIPLVDETFPAVSFPGPSWANTHSSSTGSRSMSKSSPTHEQQLPARDSHEMKIIKKKEAERLHREKMQEIEEKRKLAERTQREQSREVMRLARQHLIRNSHDAPSFDFNAKGGFSDIFGGDKSHQITIPPSPVDETFPAVSFPGPSWTNAHSSSTGGRSMSEPLPTHEQKLPARDSREMKIIKKKEAKRLHPAGD
jgi:hypothetical protein